MTLGPRKQNSRCITLIDILLLRSTSQIDLFTLQGQTDQEATVVTNIALGKPVEYCGNDTGFDYVVDGVISEQSADAPMFECYKPAYIEINLKKIYYVNYIIIYEGNSTNKSMLEITDEGFEVCNLMFNFVRMIRFYSIF